MIKHIATTLAAMALALALVCGFSLPVGADSDAPPETAPPKSVQAAPAEDSNASGVNIRGVRKLNPNPTDPIDMIGTAGQDQDPAATGQGAVNKDPAKE